MFKPGSLKRTASILLVLPIITVTAAAVAFVYLHTRRTTDTIVQQLAEETVVGVQNSLRTYFDAVENSLNTIANELAVLPLDRTFPMKVEQILYSLIQGDTVLRNVYYADTTGNLTRFEQTEDRGLILRLRNAQTGGKVVPYRLDANGQRTPFGQPIELDQRTRTGYQAAKQSGRLVWGPVVVSAYLKVPVLQPVMPVYERSPRLTPNQKPGAFRGVVGAAIPLDELNQYLRALKIAPGSVTYIINEAGELLGSSAQPTATSDPNLLTLEQSSSPLIRASAAILGRQLMLPERENEINQVSTRLAGQTYLVLASRLGDNSGAIKWWIVAIIPQEPLIQGARQGARVVLVMGLGMMVFSGFFGWWLARQVTRPVELLSQAAQAIETHKFTPAMLADLVQRQDELGELARVFRDMAEMIHQREENLHSRMQELKAELEGSRSKPLTGNQTQRWQGLLQEAAALRQDVPPTDRSV
ncbi:sensor histidine kinase, putative [Gloeomargarita lithophora Alchichica-D10]|uniref:histidine kinase n=1 Tax=Gloeomargarita lithophora Alchichica-D10 TaxID=1188229 RepID=A0A1J0AE51_9CYAN|nr:cache domain-containing protein [Gloeomargarita lithophora]APB34209.1 sensor histidine kinase, putative [Gloeomargarita lithophora Alchichica-D10]